MRKAVQYRRSSPYCRMLVRPPTEASRVRGVGHWPTTSPRVACGAHRRCVVARRRQALEPPELDGASSRPASHAGRSIRCAVRSAGPHEVDPVSRRASLTAASAWRSRRQSARCGSPSRFTLSCAMTGCASASRQARSWQPTTVALADGVAGQPTSERDASTADCRSPSRASADDVRSASGAGWRQPLAVAASPRASTVVVLGRGTRTLLTCGTRSAGGSEAARSYDRRVDEGRSIVGLAWSEQADQADSPEPAATA